MPIVVGRLAAHTPSRFRVFSSVPVATTRGGAHWKGTSNNVAINQHHCYLLILHPNYLQIQQDGIPYSKA